MTSPTVSAEQVRARMTTELSLPSRVGHTALLLASLAGVALMAALLLTEAALPPRTQLAMTGLLLVCAAWSVFAWWVLQRRRVLYAQHHVIAARMAIGFSLLFTAVSMILGMQRGSGAGWVIAPLTGIVMLVVGLFRLRAGRQRVAVLERRRVELEAALRATSGT
jgi:hypothetical protein